LSVSKSRAQSHVIVVVSASSGKPYEPGDLSKELDKRIKSAVAEFCGA
jgi:hypothetical protein